MSGSETTHSGLTRRGFLKSAGAVVALSGVSGLVGCTRNYENHSRPLAVKTRSFMEHVEVTALVGARSRLKFAMVLSCKLRWASRRSLLSTEFAQRD